MLLAFVFYIIFQFDSITNGLKRNCTLTYPNILLDCVKPLQQEFAVSEEVCKTICLQNQAKALTCQFDSHSSQCELLDVASPLESTSKSLLNLSGNYFVKRYANEGTVFLKKNKRRQSSNRCEPTLIPSIGYTFIVITKICTPSTALHVESSLIDDNVLKAPKTANVHYAGAKTATNVQPLPMNLAQINYLSSDQLRYSSNGFRQPIKGRKAAKKSDCLPSFTLRFEIVQGIEIVSNALISFHAETPDMCIYACEKNHANGTRLPTLCRSAQYDRVQKRCSFFDNSITPSGSAQYEPNKDVFYFEKVCLPESLLANCKGSLRRVPQYVLIGHATAVVDAQTHSACIEMCMRSADERGFECRSAIHFYEFPALNCILNIQSARTRPNFFSPELKQKVDYIEMNDCQETTNAPSIPDQRDLEGFIELAEDAFTKNTSASGSVPTHNNCNPLEICCPLPLPNGLDDCTHGFRLFKDGSNIECIPEACG